MARLRKNGKIWERAGADDGASLLVGNGDYFTIDQDLLFGRQAPLEIELGAGCGDFIIARAAAMPERNFLAAELSTSLVNLLDGRARRARVHNLRIVRIDARSLVNLFLASGLVSVYHIYFPDPWPKTRHAKNRLFSPWFVANLRRTMEAGAPLYIATDVADYAESIFSMLGEHGLRPTCMPVPGIAATRFARKYLAQGRKIYTGTFVK
jgi:tRNA (guanine-N7-)-methyltransferase